MVTMPAMNLDPAATPWGRAMQKELADLRATVDRSAMVEVNANKGQNSSIKALSRQVVDLTATNATLVTQQDALTAQQADLTAQQADLTAAQADLAATVAAQVAPAAGANSASGFGIDGTSTVNATVNITVPAGYTRALIFASGTTTAANGSGASDYAFAKIIIEGVAGPESSTIVNDISSAAGAFMGNLTASYTRSITGLTGGGTVTMQIATRTGGRNFGTAGGLNRAMVAGQVVFLR